MQRVDTLIKRLLEQQAAHTDASAMLLTAQMLVHELQESGKASVITGKKVSVIHPGIKNAAMLTPDIPVIELEKIVPVKEQPAVTAQQSFVFQEEQKKIEVPEERKEKIKAFAPLPRIEEIPTFAYQQKDVFELNDSISATGEQTLNERLKTEKKELGSMLKDSPVKDLKKAIGINDRFVFIEELFRGDENMYERSIKTINGFSIFPEAEYWIQRELKTKVGWDEESPTVQHFDQLVRRRFS
jgi:hypothetical protein